jgi:hypothetical protein
MNPGDVVLALLPEAVSGKAKLRPAVLLTTLPGPYQTLLLCGISTQLQNILPNWDEPIRPGDADFAGSGLRQTSVIRLSYLRSATPLEVHAVIGAIDPIRLDRLRIHLADQVRP